MHSRPPPSYLLGSKFYSDYSRNPRKAFPNNNFRRPMSEQVLTGPIDKCSIQADIYNYYCERIAIQVCEFVLQTEALQKIPEVTPLDRAEPIGSALAVACERLQVCDFISQNETSNTKIDKYNRLNLELDLTDTCNHKSFIIRSTQVLQNMLTDNYYTKNKIVGILKKHYSKKKIIFFKWNDQYDVLSILVSSRVVSQYGNDKFKICN